MPTFTTRNQAIAWLTDTITAGDASRTDTGPHCHAAPGQPCRELPDGTHRTVPVHLARVAATTTTVPAGHPTTPGGH